MKLSNEEKLAEELTQEYCKNKNCHCTPYTRCDFVRGYKHGILTGLKAKTQWHTDPNDLPPMIQDERHISERVWINVENWGTEDGHYDYYKNCWIIRCRIVNLPILGWIEIPKWEV